jgi:MoaA/NifB/PqqE/SkfB family radical SAM enzyme
VIARRARERGFFLVVLTNGFLVDEEKADTLADLAAKVEVSVYSVDEEAMDRITGRPGSGRRAKGAVSLLRARGVEVVVKTPLMTLNRDAISGVAAWAETEGATLRKRASRPGITATSMESARPILNARSAVEGSKTSR